MPLMHAASHALWLIYNSPTHWSSGQTQLECNSVTSAGCVPRSERRHVDSRPEAERGSLLHLMRALLLPIINVALLQVHVLAGQ